jgi:cell division protein FtsQ
MAEDDRLETGMDLDPEEEPQYLRRQKRVEVRKRLDTRKIARVKMPLLSLAAVLALSGAAWGITRFALASAAFSLHPENVEIQGAHYVSREQVMERFSGDIGRSVFSVPLEARRSGIEEIPWVERADLARLWPDRIRVMLHERAPVAFAPGPGGMLLVDSSGQFLERPVQASFSFPVVVGVAENDPTGPRRARMAMFNALMQDLDREGTRYSLDISEVDVSDPEDAQVTVVDTAIVLHLGSADFLKRYKTYLAHIQQWHRDFPKIRSIDLRYDRQVVVNPDTRPDVK